MKPKAPFSAIILFVSGCSAYEIPALNNDHPASLMAMSAPQRSISKTLAYTREDMPASASAAAQHGEHQTRPTEDGLSKTVVGEGEVISTVPKASRIVLEHGEIKDFMEAMTMGYRAEPPSLLEGLKPGDRVRFAIDVPKKSIIKIEKLN